MVAAYSLPLPEAAKPLSEQRMLLHGVSWQEYVALREALDRPSLRMTYCQGVLEFMSPSRTHELRKKSIARLVELYAVLRDLPLVGYGSTTFRMEAKERGAEPDECYRLGTLMRDGEFPDIVLEVILTNPLLDKLRVYQGFAVPEVWLYQNGTFAIHRLGSQAYERVERSAFLPEIDFDLIARLAGREDQHEALRELKKLL